MKYTMFCPLGFEGISCNSAARCPGIPLYQKTYTLKQSNWKTSIFFPSVFILCSIKIWLDPIYIDMSTQMALIMSRSWKVEWFVGHKITWLPNQNKAILTCGFHLFSLFPAVSHCTSSNYLRQLQFNFDKEISEISDNHINQTNHEKGFLLW